MANERGAVANLSLFDRDKVGPPAATVEQINPRSSTELPRPNGHHSQ
jgi:hypothetical protein